MDADAGYALNAEVALAKVLEGEVIVINVATGRYHSLEGSGTAAWVWLTDGASPRTVSERMAERYAVDPAVALADLEPLVADLLAAELVVQREGPAVPEQSPLDDDVEPYAAPTITAFSDMEDMLAFDPPLPSTAEMPEPWKPAAAAE